MGYLETVPLEAWAKWEEEEEEEEALEGGGGGV